jgi:hypothetical protein
VDDHPFHERLPALSVYRKSRNPLPYPTAIGSEAATSGGGHTRPLLELADAG